MVPAHLVQEIGKKILTAAKKKITLCQIITMKPHKDLLSIFIFAQPVGSRIIIIRQIETVRWEPFLVRNFCVDVLERTGQTSAGPLVSYKNHLPFPNQHISHEAISYLKSGDIPELENARMRHERPYRSQSHMIFDIKSACVTAEWRQHEGIDGGADSKLQKSAWIGLLDKYQRQIQTQIRI